MKEFNGIWLNKEILDIEELNINDKVILASINSLSKTRVCNVSNNYLSKTTKLSLRCIKDIMNRLEKNGFIIRRTDGRNREIFLGAFFTSKEEPFRADLVNNSTKNEILGTKRKSFGTSFAQYNIDNKNKINKKGPSSIKEVLESMNYFKNNE